MLQKTVETYPESADAHSLYAQVCRKFKAEEILIHGASNLSDLKGSVIIFHLRLWKESLENFGTDTMKFT